MSSLVLLLNFTEEEINKLSALPLDFERGYLSNARRTTDTKEAKHSTPVQVNNVYLPYPPYEYRVVAVDLSLKTALEEEFAAKSEEIIQNIRSQFSSFRGVYVVLLGNYDNENLFNIGLSGIAMTMADNDRSAFCVLKEDPLTDFFDSMTNQIVLPPSRYIRQPGNLQPIYVNRAGKILGAIDRRYEGPLVLVLPQFKNNLLMIERLLKKLSQTSKNFLPEIYHPDWMETERYYPREIAEYNAKAEELTKKFESDIKELQQQKEKAKQKFEHVRAILYQKGEELKHSVLFVLREIFGLKVEDADKLNLNVLPREDLIIEHDARRILTEVKGTNAQNPPQSFITQVWKHLFKAQNEGINEGALILNHDLTKDPDERSLAYAREMETELNEIIFIDTMVLHRIAIAILAGKISKEEASNILLKKGRVEFLA